MDSLDAIEAHFDFELPPIYRRWVDEGFLDFTSPDDLYLWVYEAEWIPPPEIPGWSLPTFGTHIDGLVPFAFSGAGDPWCWQLDHPTAPAEHRIIFCPHDEEFATVYAPDFVGWFYRTCLEYAESIDEGEGVDEARDYLDDWAGRLRLVGHGDLATELLELGAREPIRYRPDPDREFDELGFLHSDEVESRLEGRFGAGYLDHEIEWQASPYRADRETPEEIEAAHRRFAQERRAQDYASKTIQADEAYRDRNYARYVSLLDPFEELLSPAQQEKMALARRRS